MTDHWRLPLSLLTLALPVAGLADDAADRLQRLERELDTLRAQVEATADAVASAAPADRTRVGGYGELHYNHLDTPSGDRRSLDFHRFVLFFGHDFSDALRFQSELEVEHAVSGGDEPGEVELEQAYVEMDLTDSTVLRAGLVLLPVGILNETHEPPTFYGVERNPVEKHILPATWWEGGVGLSGRQAARGLSWDLLLHSGLKVDPATVSIRGGRQKAAKADASKLAATGRLRYTAIPGLELAASLQWQDDISQRAGDGVDGGTLLSTHLAWRHGPLGLRALYARWDIDGAQARALGRDRQWGAYAEGSYRVTPRLGLFARHNAWHTADGVDATQQNLGLNWWPHEDVVFKADLQWQNADAGDADGFNLGIGYQF